MDNTNPDDQSTQAEEVNTAPLDNTAEQTAPETTGADLESTISPETEQATDEQTTDHAQAPIAKSKKKLFIILGLVGALIITGAVAAVLILFVLKKDEPVAIVTPAPIETSIAVDTEAIGTPVVEVAYDDGLEYIEPVILDLAVSWQTPEKTSLRGYYENEIEYTGDKELDDIYSVENSSKKYVQYFKAGTFVGGEIVYAHQPLGGLGGDGVEVFMVKGTNVTLLMRYTNSYENTVTQDLSGQDIVTTPLMPGISLDKKSIIRGTLAPEKLVLDGQNMKALASYLQGGYYPEKYQDPASTETMVKSIPEGKIYEIVKQKDGYKLSLFELELPNSFRVSYVLDGEISSTEVQPITWTDGTRNTYSFANFGYGCGGGSYFLVADLTVADLTQIGKSDKGQPIYTFKNMSQKVAAQILSEVNSRGENSWIDPEKDPPYTAEEFKNDKAAIIVEDGMGRWVVFKNSRNFVAGGCAKPVIYLYPESPLAVDVQVGADVTISDPQYEINGWQNVTALPSGQLMYRGRPYESLFWEGIGHGTYPDKSGYGTVVPRSSAISTMYSHLAEQGFNQKESEDFVEFWSLNIPSGNYIRLTWLSTSEMNTLAPLRISTRPDTVIRTFLEMEGLENYVQLTPQTFRAPARNGFVLTEWGGLAINGLQNLTHPK